MEFFSLWCCVREGSCEIFASWSVFAFRFGFSCFGSFKGIVYWFVPLFNAGDQTGAWILDGAPCLAPCRICALNQFGRAGLFVVCLSAVSFCWVFGYVGLFGLGWVCRGYRGG